MKDNFESALQFALDAHKGQLDNGWTPYIMHLMGVWSRVREENLTTQIVALLHDTVEDTSITVNQIADNFGEDVAYAVRILTHQKHQPYKAYIESIAHSGNRAALVVKLADLEDNSSVTRLQRLPKEKQDYFEKRIQEKYLPAIARLTIALGTL